MIQRVQTLFMTLVIILSAVLFFIPFLSMQIRGIECTYYVSKIVEAKPDTFVIWNTSSIILNSLIIILTAIAIFAFKNRSLQVRLCAMNIVFNLGILVLLWLQIKDIPSTYNFAIGITFPIINAILLYIAIHYILKDIKKLKSLDRIR